MSEYLETAKKLRAITEIHYNCAQSVMVPFAEKAGMDPDQVYRIGANFGGGMKMGSVCGVITGGLMTLGMLGIDDPKDANAFCRRIRENHEGCMDCRDLLRINAQRGGQKKPHCDAMVYEAVELVEAMMTEKGI